MKNKRKKKLSDFFGIWKEDSDEWEKRKKEIYKDRERFKLRDFNYKKLLKNKKKKVDGFGIVKSAGSFKEEKEKHKEF